MSASQRRIVCLGIVGKKSEPLLIRTPDPASDPKESLNLSGLIHAAQDVIEERVQKMAAGGLGQQCLGLLLTVLDLRVYGYVTNTLIKFIVVVRDVHGDTNMKPWLQALHRLYVAHVCNPFTPLDTKLQPGPRFEQQLATLIARWEERPLNPVAAAMVAAKQPMRAVPLSPQMQPQKHFQQQQ